MSKHSDKKKLQSPPSAHEHAPSYYQTYKPSEYVPSYQPSAIQGAAIFNQPLLYGQSLYAAAYPPTVLQAEPIVLPSVKKVVQGEAIIARPSVETHGCSCSSHRTTGSQVVTRQFVVRPTKSDDQYSKKLDEIERLHNQEVKELELKMQSQLDQLNSQSQINEQSRQINELKQTVNDLRSQLSQSRVSQVGATFQPYPVYQPAPEVPRHQPSSSSGQFSGLHIEKLEKDLSKKKNKIKNLKVHVETLKNELSHKNNILGEYEIRLQSAENALRNLPRERIVHEIPPQPRQFDREREELINELRMLRLDNDQLKQRLFATDQDKLVLQSDLTKVVGDIKMYESENKKLAGILFQKDELIRTLEQRLSVELSRQSMLLQQSSPQRVVVEQISRPVHAQYVVDPTPQQHQYIITDTYQQPVKYTHTAYLPQQQILTQQQTVPQQQSVVQPTLVQTLPTVQIQQQ